MKKHALKSFSSSIKNKLRSEVDERVMLYRQRIVSLVWEIIFLSFGLIFLLLGFVAFLETLFPKHVVFLSAGILLIIVGIFFGSRSLSR